MMAPVEELRTDRESLLNALTQAGARIIGNTILCPFHSDKHPSAAVYETDGVWRYKCHAASCGFCGDIFDVRAKAEGRAVEDVLREVGGGQAKPRKTVYPTVDAAADTFPNVEAKYVYANPDTRHPDLVVIRYRKADGRKAFCQMHPVAGGFIMEGIPKPWPLYNRTRVRASESVVVVEGEKCVHALQSIGIVATTSPGGAGKADYVDWSPLGGKTVTLWPDNDEGGRKHMERVAEILTLVDPPVTVYMVDPSDIYTTNGVPLGEKGDAADLIDAIREEAAGVEGVERAWIDGVLAGARSLGRSSELLGMMEDVASGKRAAIDWPWPILSGMARSLIPGTVTVVCGSPGATKSFWLLEAAAYWHEQGVPVAVYELEEDIPYHLLRVLAQRTRNGDLFDDGWMKANRDVWRRSHAEHSAFLDSFGRCLWACPNQEITLPQLNQWIEERAKAGARIIAIDPVTAASKSAKPWNDDLQFLIRAKQTVREYDTSLVLVTHPKVGLMTKPGLDGLSGGSAYQRFSQTVFWIERHDQRKEVEIMSGGYSMTIPVEINRTVHMSKTRNGKGHGLSLGYTFDAGLRFVEHGIIKKDAK